VRWTWAVGDYWEPYEVDPLEEHIGESADNGRPTLVTVDQWPNPEPNYGHTHFRHDVISYAEEVRSVDGGHIVRHDPARVLREVEAKRALLAAATSYSPELEYGDNGEWAFDLAVRLLASVWSDHPDYLPEWSPGNVTPPP
jgi:hypothetical protein